ncbi:MAG: peptide-N-glycosidase F-related protein, partial [Chitinophagales bacterium]
LQQWKGSWLHKKFDQLDQNKTYKKAYLVLELGCASYGCCVWDYGFHAYIGKPIPGYDTMKFSKKDTVTWNAVTVILDSLWINRKTSNVEVASLITPYGTYMRAGSNGFTNNWTHPYVFDVTDYLPLMKDSFALVIESGGYDGKKGFNLTADLILIEGNSLYTPKRVINAYGKGYSYKNEAQIDTIIKPYKFKLASDENQAKFRTIVTGHNQDGEFSPIEYYVTLNEQEVFSKRLWRNDCDKTHVQPQGGTWVFSRCNWCPGEKVIDFEIDLTPYLKATDSNVLKISFRKMETNSTNIQASYAIAGNIITYGNKSPYDISLIDVIAPSKDKTYFLHNPLCQGPRVKIRNEGTKSVKEAYIDYWVDINNKTTHIWKGNLMPEQSEVVQLPAFPWNNVNYNSPIFFAALQKTADNLITWNDQIRSEFDIPAVFSTQKLKFEIKTTNDTKDNTLKIYNEVNQEVFTKVYKNDNKTYSDTITLADGCYRMELVDFDDRLDVGDGLNFWWSTQQLAKTTGSFTIRNATNNATLKSFNADFGGMLNFQFTINSLKIGEYTSISSYDYKAYKFPDTIKTNIQTANNDEFWYLSPNPSADGRIQLNFIGTEKQSVEVKVFSLNGKLSYHKAFKNLSSFEELNLSHLPRGTYIVRVNINGKEDEKKWIFR